MVFCDIYTSMTSLKFFGFKDSEYGLDDLVWDGYTFQ